jgi:hypothetical protein
MNIYAVEYSHDDEPRQILVKAESLFEAGRNLHPSIASRAYVIYLFSEVVDA